MCIQVNAARKFHSSGRGDVYGPRYGEGDVVGAGIEMATREIFFTRNGVSVYCSSVISVVVPSGICSRLCDKEIED